MCGIVGFTHRNRFACRALIARATASLHHRGPDQQDVFVSPDACLGAVRLQVVDSANGKQPMASACRETVVVYNGEIYNHIELRQELEARGHRFETNCDTEVVLNAFREWDTGCFARFRGMFAIAVWSSREKRLVLARDRIGIKPLYYHLLAGDICFGSELKAIFEHPQVSRQLDTSALQDFLALNYVPSPRTLVKGIHKIPPGHFLEHRAGRTSIQAYWELAFRPDPAMRMEAAVERLNVLMGRAVREEMAADVPFGVWSSGGIDSSTILHYAAEASSQPLRTFSVGFASRDCDESRYFREMSSRYGTHHHELEIAPGPKLISAIEDFAYYSDEPGADAGALPMWFLSKMTGMHCTVALSGDGGDELFGGYLTYAADRAARPFRKLPFSIRCLMRAGAERFLPVSDRKLSFEYKVKRFLAGAALHPDDAHFFWNGASSDAIELGGIDTLRHRLYEGAPVGRANYLNRYLYVDQKYYLPDNILYKVDRMSMAHSVEARPPMLDHRIVEFAASLPQNLKMRGNRQKAVLKELMRDKLPASILNRSKKGFDIPTHDWFRGFLRPLLMDTLTPKAMEQTGLADFRATHSVIRAHMERRVNAGYHLWGLMTLFLWLKKWNIEVTPSHEYSPALLAPIPTGTN